MLNEMPYDEFLNWHLYFESRPVGWREDLRTTYILQQNSDKIKGPDIFPSLVPIFNTERDTMASFKTSGLRSALLNAVGGDKLEFL